MADSNVAMTNDQIIHDAFILGSQIVELKSRIQISLFDPDDFSLQTASVWRSIVNRITALQIKAFPDSSTENTLYEPPGRDSLPYLYPPSPDYGNVGIAGNNNAGEAILGNFKIYEVTRRAINCLTLLHMNPEQSLIPDVINKNKEHLITKILEAGEDKGAGGGAVQSAENTAQISDGGEEANAETIPKPKTRLETAIAFLTERTVKFLEAWDGYLRENYYAGGLLPDDESELVAYEAGHSMSLLSWGISLSTIQNEKEGAGKDQNELRNDLITSWTTVFRDNAVIRLQHQISALSTVLDDAFYVRTSLKRPEENAVLQIPNPDLPSQAITAVKHSIEFWQRTIKWIAGPNSEGKIRSDSPAKGTEWSKQMRMALIEQSNIWSTLLTGQQSLRAFTLESITRQLMKEVTEKVQEKLKENFKGSLHQAETAMKEIADEVKQAISIAGKAALNGIEEMYQSYKRFLIPAGIAIAAIFIVLVVIALMVGKEWIGATGGAGVTGLFTLVLGSLGLTSARGTKNSHELAIKNGQEAAQTIVENKTATVQNDNAANAGNSIMSRIQGVGQEAGKMMMQAINNGYEQIKIELSGLGRSAAVSYPLIEFFTLSFTLSAEGEFLTDIIWSGKDREEELERILAAAFGNMAMFISPSKHTLSKGLAAAEPVAKSSPAAASANQVSNVTGTEAVNKTGTASASATADDESSENEKAEAADDTNETATEEVVKSDSDAGSESDDTPKEPGS